MLAMVASNPATVTTGLIIFLARDSGTDATLPGSSQPAGSSRHQGRSRRSRMPRSELLDPDPSTPEPVVAVIELDVVPLTRGRGPVRDHAIGIGCMDLDGEDLAGDVGEVLRQVVETVQPEPNAVGDLQANRFAEVLDVPDDLAGHPSTVQLVVDGEVERNDRGTVTRDGEAFLGKRAELHVAGPELDRPARELHHDRPASFERGRCGRAVDLAEGGANLLHRCPQPRAERFEVGDHVEVQELAELSR